MSTPEADPADVAEQSLDAAPGQHRLPTEVPLEADELDAAEQAVVVEHDEDDRP